MSKIQHPQAAALRVTSELVDSKIRSVEYHCFPDSRLTICAMTLQNGEVVTGESATPVGEEYVREKGEAKAREKARGKIWALERYLLREQAYQIQQQNELHGLMSGMLGAADVAFDQDLADDPCQPPTPDFLITTARLGKAHYLSYSANADGSGQGYAWSPELSHATLFANRREARFFIQNNLAQAERMSATVSRKHWEREGAVVWTFPANYKPELQDLGKPYDDLARDFSQAPQAKTPETLVTGPIIAVEQLVHGVPVGKMRYLSNFAEGMQSLTTEPREAAVFMPQSYAQEIADKLAQENPDARFSVIVGKAPPAPMPIAPEAPAEKLPVELVPINSMRPEGNVPGNWWIISLRGQEGLFERFYHGPHNVEATVDLLVASLTEDRGQGTTFISLQEAQDFAEGVRAVVPGDTHVLIIERGIGDQPLASEEKPE